MKRKCDGCKALEVDRYNYTCLLGYKVKRFPLNAYIDTIKPQEECPKPMTHGRFIEELRQARQQKRGNIIGWSSLENVREKVERGNEE